MERTDYTKEVNGSPLKEVFGYDNDRLINWQVGSLPLKSVSYEINGNIKNKSDVSGNDYTYHPTRKHAVNNVNNGSADLKKYFHSIQYNVNNAPSSITSDDGSVSLNYLYGLGDERVKSQLVKGGTTVSKYYLGNYEVVNTNGVEHSVIYVSFPGTGLIAMLVTTDQSTKVFPVYKDHLGSITKITNEDGDIVAEQSFDPLVVSEVEPWGRRRDPNTWDINQPIVGNGLDWLYRGFTGHEMLDDFDIIHMRRPEPVEGNGRLYDPLMARMLSPDNFVQSASNSQNYNRYSYVLNNPIKYTDPSGEFIFTALIPGAGIFIDAALWGAVIGGAGYTASVAFSDGGFNNWNGSQFWTSVGVGAISGVATAGIGSGFGSTGSFGHELARAGTHGFVNGGLAKFQGGSFGAGFGSGAIGSLAGSGFQAWGGEFAQSGFGTVGFSAFGGGVGAELGGGNFWRGAGTGGTVGLLNHSSKILQEHINDNLGRYFSSREEALNYMYSKSMGSGIEGNMLEYTKENGKTKFYVGPWDKNKPRDSFIDPRRAEGFFENSTNRFSYHTHVSNNWPSPTDFQNHSGGNFYRYDRAFVLNKTSVWETRRYNMQRPTMLVPRGVPTGTYLGSVNDWLNGNYVGW
ncbi:MAG: RHS repeat-associated protein [Sphingobacteriales bacterium]|jgi:RHS repeat-associated protein